jgi:hypothetical protein
MNKCIKLLMKLTTGICLLGLIVLAGCSGKTGAWHTARASYQSNGGYFTNTL